jgi:hypothetical protein
MAPAVYKFVKQIPSLLCSGSGVYYRQAVNECGKEHSMSTQDPDSPENINRFQRRLNVYLYSGLIIGAGLMLLFVVAFLAAFLMHAVRFQHLFFEF